MDKSTIDTDVRRILLKKEDYHRSLAYVIELYKTAQEATQILKVWNESTAPLESSATILEFDDIRNVFKRWCFYSTLINRQEGLVIQGEMIRRGYINKPFKHNELELNYRRYFIEQNKSDDKIEEMKTICWFCPHKATMNLRIHNGKPVYEGEQVQIGGNESYYPVCRKHYFHPQLKQ